MKLIIVEGTDNIGKDTVINKLCEHFNSVTLIHCDGPKSKIFTPYEQDEKFLTYAKNIKNGLYNSTDCIIMNRSHIGEFVYGQLYRNRNEYKIYELIDNVNYILKTTNNLTIKYIQLLSSSIELRKTFDDNKSLSKMNDILMERENELFLEIYNYVNLDKKLIYVNDEDGFLPREEIFKEVIDFLNEQ